jgi:pilus assembly protein CpaB
MSIRWVRQALTAALLLAAGVLFFNEFVPVSDRSQPAQETVTVPPPPPTFSIARAAAPIARGSIIGPDDVQIEQSPTAPAKGTLSSVQEATDRIAIRNIGASEALSQSNTAATPEGTRLSQAIPEGLRAISLSVSENSSVANLIRPGDRVDVLVVSNSRTPPAAGRVFPPAQVLTVLQNIPVLAVGRATVVEGSNNANVAARTVALAVTPRQAAMIALIPAVGNEYLTLRPADDAIELAASPVSTDDLQPNPPVVQRPVAAAAPAAQPRARTRSIEVIAGKSDNVSRVNLAERR